VWGFRDSDRSKSAAGGKAWIALIQGVSSPASDSARPVPFEPGEDRVQLFFAVCAMKPLNCGKTFVPLQVGHFGFAFSRSAIVMMSSKGFLPLLAEELVARHGAFTLFSQRREAIVSSFSVDSKDLIPSVNQGLHFHRDLAAARGLRHRLVLDLE
jgi:hypothetical protein